MYVVVSCESNVTLILIKKLVFIAILNMNRLNKKNSKEKKIGPKNETKYHFILFLLLFLNLVLKTNKQTNLLFIFILDIEKHTSTLYTFLSSIIL